jgi:outer membrane protein assembly factor BamB
LLSLVSQGYLAVADDWPQWGGPQRDLNWREDGIVDNLPAIDPAIGMLPRVWTAKIDSGYSGPVVADGRVFVTDRIADRNLERVLCFDAGSGEPRWQHEYESRYTISYPLGPRAAPTVDGERVYTFGAMGHLFCFNVATGDILWKKHLPGDFRTEVPGWGMAGAPLVEGDQLILLAGAHPGALVLSLDKFTGEERWRALEGKDPGYCAPVILTIAGCRQLIIWHPEAVVGLDPRSGAVLWEQPSFVGAGMSISTPRAIGNRLFVSSFFSGPLMIDLGPAGNSPNVLWRAKANANDVVNDTLHSVMSTPIVTKKNVYGIGSYGELRCLDADTGEIVWQSRQPTGNGRWWNAYLIPHGERVVICNEQGEIIFCKLSPLGYQELCRAKLIEPTEPIGRRMVVWSHPAFAMRSVFARNDDELIRVNLAAH